MTAAPDQASAAEARLRAVLAQTPPDARWTIAVSGGVDSVTLATVAHRAGLAHRPIMMHATSPAVPSDAGARLIDFAKREGWDLQVVAAGELDDPQYRANPYDRCYFCKSALYRTMLRQLADRMGPGHVLASGANLDDLGDHRPGLVAATEHGVKHPLIEAGIDKPTIRAIARRHGLSDFSELPAQPCLASRVETGIMIDPEQLRFIDQLETCLRKLAGQGATLRVRLRAAGVEVELEPALCSDDQLTAELSKVAVQACAAQDRVFSGVKPYRRGSAFLAERGA